MYFRTCPPKIHLNSCPILTPTRKMEGWKKSLVTDISVLKKTFGSVTYLLWPYWWSICLHSCHLSFISIPVSPRVPPSPCYGQRVLSLHNSKQMRNVTSTPFSICPTDGKLVSFIIITISSTSVRPSLVTLTVIGLTSILFHLMSLNQVENGFICPNDKKEKNSPSPVVTLSSISVNVKLTTLLAVPSRCWD